MTEEKTPTSEETIKICSRTARFIKKHMILDSRWILEETAIRQLGIVRKQEKQIALEAVEIAKKQAEEKALEAIVKKMKEDPRFPRIFGTKMLENHQKEVEETERRVRLEITKKIFQEIEKKDGNFFTDWKGLMIGKEEYQIIKERFLKEAESK